LPSDSQGVGRETRRRLPYSWTTPEAVSFKEFGDILGPLLIGALALALSLSVAFVICGTLGLLSLALIILSDRRAAASRSGPVRPRAALSGGFKHAISIENRIPLSESHQTLSRFRRPRIR